MKCVIACVARDENPYINEWIKHHLDIGFDEVCVFDNCSAVPLVYEIDRLPSEYRRRVLVEIEPVSFDPQISAFSRALAYYRDKAEWLGFFDVDEFVQVERPLADILNLEEKVGSLFVFWRFYNANGLEKYDDRPVRERFTQVCGSMIGNGIIGLGKPISRIKDIVQADPHLPQLVRGKCRVTEDGVPFGNVPCSSFVKDIVLNHYYTKSYEEWLWKINRGSCNSGPLSWRKYDEFFWYNPDLKHLYDSSLANLTMSCGHYAPFYSAR